MQFYKLHQEIDKLQIKYGARKFIAIYGAGCVVNPKLMLVFMNPTSKNISTQQNWNGMRTPWLGTKNAWKFFYQLGFISKDSFEKTQHLKPYEWDPNFAFQLYREIEKSRIYVTNLAKCTQVDAKPLRNKVFREYLNILHQEILLATPKKIITFGNQVSSIILGKPISVRNYKDKEYEELIIKNRRFLVYPVYYPIGQGMRNMPLAIKRIKIIISDISSAEYEKYG